MTASKALLIEVRWPDGRFHGVRDPQGGEREAMTPEWPPSPFRLFQALVAGAYGGRWAGEPPEAKDSVFAWLERQAAPTILAPPAERLDPLTYFVPNNDLDTKGGDPARIGEIRTVKTVRPSLFDPDRPVGYLWPFDGEDDCAEAIAALADRLHTLGHGVDAAFATGEVLTAEAAQARVDAFDGLKLKPQTGPPRAGEAARPCPAPGSLRSLHARHSAAVRRFETVGRGRQTRSLFRQPPKAHARAVAYARPPERRLFELRSAAGAGPLAPWPLEDAYGLAVAVRDRLAERLGPGEPRTERFVVGRTAGAADAGRRVRILPLPSIGFRHTDPRIRRVLIELPPDCPVSPSELDWALAGQSLSGPRGEPGMGGGVLLVPTPDDAMALHYGVNRSARVWRSVTPLALPDGAARRRIDPVRLAVDAPGEAKPGGERAQEETQAAVAIGRALRHVGVSAAVHQVRVQREPLGKGLRAEAFAADGRFGKERLWHAEIRFAEPVAGPMAVGDGRFCGLGLLAPVTGGVGDLFAFQLAAEGALFPSDHPALIQAARRALMARARDAQCLPLFAGHEQDGAPARSGQHRHVYLGMTGEAAPILWVVAPWRVDRTWRPTPLDRRAFRRVAEGLSTIRAGALGVIGVQPADGGVGQLCGPARTWVSATPYEPDRRAGARQDAAQAAMADIVRACLRLGQPRPEVELLSAEGADGVFARLRFARTISGPLLAGRSAHRGGGLFLPA